MPETFRIFFNRKKQWIDVFLWDVHPTTFANWKGGRWGYFIAKWENPKSGLLGEIHFVESRLDGHEDTVVHEFDHARWEWMWANRVLQTSRNEEQLTSMLDEMVGKFYKAYRKYKKGNKNAK